MLGTYSTGDATSGKQGVDFQFAALQNLNAASVGGSTLHQALGLETGGARRRKGQASLAALAKRVSRWRWLVVDEISMVSAKLLAQIDTKLRSLVHLHGTYKQGADGMDRPFGGLNVLFVGDFFQLDPPSKDIAICKVPDEEIRLAKAFAPAPTAAHGQQLFWGGPSVGVQGVHELTTAWRCRDPWLLEVQEQCRDGALSKDNYNFLHGLETQGAGSTIGGEVTCGTEQCRTFKDTWGNVQWEVRKNLECHACAVDRASRCRVVDSPDDPRLNEDKFQNALLVVANNDVKYDTNKKRALHFAASRREGVTWCQAKDTPSTAALQENPSIVVKKKDWLQRHDRDCGDLYGLFPLVHKLPKMVTDHLDRSPDKRLLRGTSGYIHSWLVAPDETSEMAGGERILAKLPTIVYVKFPGATWVLDGLSEPGLYPVRTVTKYWYLDQKRKYPVLRIKRQQLPLAPGFAVTAHSSQGKTLDASILDLCIGKEPVGSGIGALAHWKVGNSDFYTILILNSGRFEIWNIV